MGVRENILESIRLRLVAANAVTTVKRTTQPEPEMRRITRSQLPIAHIVEPRDDRPTYRACAHADNKIEFEVLLDFEHWDPDNGAATVGNQIIDAVINSIHGDFENSGNSYTTSILSTKSTMVKHPVYRARIGVSAEWYASTATR